MNDPASGRTAQPHGHVFLAADHDRSERRTWAVIALCGAMMLAEIVGGLAFGSIALVADGLHMSTHAGALLLAALAYTYARQHANDARFTFGTGKLGDLAGFTSAIVLAMIALLIGYESIVRLLEPVAIRFSEAIPIACAGLAVNIASAWLLSRGDHHHGPDRGHGNNHHPESRSITTNSGILTLEIFEDGVPPRFRLFSGNASDALLEGTSIETERSDGTRQVFSMRDRGQYLESIEEIPEPHAFTARIRDRSGAHHALVFEEHAHETAAHRDNNLRAALVHVAADAAVSVLVIVGLVLARIFGWLWMDALAGIIGAFVIANWSYGLIRDTGAILLDMNPDRKLSESLRNTIEGGGDRITDVHLWRVGPGHVAAIISVVTREARDPDFYRSKLKCFKSLSHVTVEVVRVQPI